MHFVICWSEPSRHVAVSESCVSSGDLSMHTEAVKTRVFHVTPVSEDTQLHTSIHLIAGVLHEREGAQEEKENEKNWKRKSENVNKKGLTFK